MVSPILLFLHLHLQEYSLAFEFKQIRHVGDVLIEAVDVVVDGIFIVFDVLGPVLLGYFVDQSFVFDAKQVEISKFI